jgi:biopolymer transport protein ExbD
MSLIPEEELKKQNSVSLAAMVDFLFVVVAVFATMAITRAALFDRDIELVQTQDHSTPSLASQPTHVVNISITEEGAYKWVTEMSEFVLEGAIGIKKEFYRQQQIGLIPQQHDAVQVLLHIDKNARWEAIAQAIFSIQEAGFSTHPVYETIDDN